MNGMGWEPLLLAWAKKVALVGICIWYCHSQALAIQERFYICNVSSDWLSLTETIYHVDKTDCEIYVLAKSEAQIAV